MSSDIQQHGCNDEPTFHKLLRMVRRDHSRGHLECGLQPPKSNRSGDSGDSIGLESGTYMAQIYRVETESKGRQLLVV